MQSSLQADQNPRSWTDEVLIAAVARGDRDCFLALYDRYAARLLGLIVGVLRDRAASEDVLQEVMLEVWQRHAARFNPVLGSVEGWLLRLARSRAIDAVRKRSRRTSEGVDAAVAGEDGGVGGPAAVGAGQSVGQGAAWATSEVVSAALELLRPEDREPLVLAFCHGMSREAIAVHLRVPVGTVKTRIYRAVQTLRAALVTEEASR